MTDENNESAYHLSLKDGMRRNPKYKPPKREGNRFITIENPTGIFVMINTKKEEVYLCSACLKPRDDGYVGNKADCEHGAPHRPIVNEVK